MPSGSNVIHFGAIRIRATGVGKLRYQFQGYDDIVLENLVPHDLSNTNARELTRLSNFQGQAGKLKIEQTAKGEIMRVNHVIIFVKQLWTDYPG